MSNEKKPFNQSRDANKNRNTPPERFNRERIDGPIERSQLRDRIEGRIEKGFRKDKKK